MKKSEENKAGKQGKIVEGFSQWPKKKKIDWIDGSLSGNEKDLYQELSSYWHDGEEEQSLFEGFSENTVSNFHLPYGIAPNFLINNNMYAVPMVTEESSVVAAASSAAKFWARRGGVKTKVLGTVKNGHISFLWLDKRATLESKMPGWIAEMKAAVKPVTQSMEKRGGGIREVALKCIDEASGIYQLFVKFETCDSMGANFINTVLEEMASKLEVLMSVNCAGGEVLLSILSNYNPECLVLAELECPIQALGEFPGGMDAEAFAHRFHMAVTVALKDTYRAVTHNKGIMNGVDAVALATANDFRAIESGAHAYACRDGQYRSLSRCTLENNQFHFSMEIPLAVGTVGGLTRLHPLARRSLEILGRPDAQELMQIMAAVGLVQNFAAVKSLVTSGIQSGHMRMHLRNILQENKIPEQFHNQICQHFLDHKVSVSAVKDYYRELSK
ncbi:MAG TPA: hydroxymethylglutaryl-CoA reductase, degradative [Saprospiraceae bacterium]|nr:hydroxymethylglutaryl-CoA reductase, degradative [Saprospiraceae bacterium]